MLRSLVGSEMCIRDRPSTPQRKTPPNFAVKNRVAARVSKTIANAQPDHPCLLYTSDAADDLLCVDLGGRRIIKKKIHT